MQTSNKLSWDDYRYVLAIFRAHGVTGAASNIGVNVSTAFRRLDKIEGTVQTMLFDRRRGGYVPTAAGQEVVRAAEIMEQAVFSADRTVSGHDQDLTGELRITATETMAVCFLTRHMKSFRQKHPGLTVNISSENRVLSLSEREADIALRPRRPTDESLIGRKIANLRWGIFGRADRIEKIPGTKKLKKLSDLARQQFVVWDGGVLAKETEDWMVDHIPDVDLILRSSSLITNAQVAATGAALTLLPCIVGTIWPDLEPVISPLKDNEKSGELWLAFHEDMRHNARVRALVEHIAEAASEDTALFEGR